MTERHDLVALVARNYDGNPIQALQALGREFGIAIAYLDRTCFADYVADHRGEDRLLTDAEWDALKGSLDDYDDFVDNTRGPTERIVPHEFMRYLLQRNNVEPPAPDDPWETDTDCRGE